MRCQLNIIASNSSRNILFTSRWTMIVGKKLRAECLPLDLDDFGSSQINVNKFHSQTYFFKHGLDVLQTYDWNVLFVWYAAQCVWIMMLLLSKCVYNCTWMFLCLVSSAVALIIKKRPKYVCPTESYGPNVNKLYCLVTKSSQRRIEFCPTRKKFQ